MTAARPVGVALLSVAFVALLAVGLRNLFRGPDVSGFRVLQVVQGEGPVALEGKVYVPPDVQLRSRRGNRLRAEDQYGRPLALRITRFSSPEVTFTMPAGYPADSKQAFLVLQMRGEPVARASLGPLPARRQDFPVQPRKDLEALAMDNGISLRLALDVPPGDVVTVQPIRTDASPFLAKVALEMNLMADGWRQAHFQTPYSSQVRKLEVKVSHFPYLVDEFEFEGAALVEESGVGYFEIKQPVEGRSRDGRRVRVPAQRNEIQADNEIYLVAEVLETGERWSWRPFEEVLSPSPASLGLRGAKVRIRFPNDSGGGGMAVRPGPNGVQSRKYGPIGTMRIGLPPRERPEPKETVYAVPVVPFGF